MSDSNIAQWHRLSEFQAVLILSLAVVGLGNIWHLPALALRHGGGAFLIVYTAALLLIGWTLFCAELGLGKMTGQRMGHGLRNVILNQRMSRFWLVMTWTFPLATLGLMAIYGALSGWALAYLFEAAVGLTRVDSLAMAQQRFLELTASPGRSLFWHSLFWAVVCLILAQGWRRGLMRAAAWFAAIALLLTLVLAVRMPMLSGGGQALSLYQIDWQQFGWRGFWAALSQACLTLSVGLGLIYVVGRRLFESSNPMRVAIWVVLIDLGFSLAIGAGVVSLHWPGNAISAGPGLVFVDLVASLADERGIQVAFFALLVILATSSAMLLLEPMVQSTRERLGCLRAHAAVMVCGLAWALGIITVVSFGVGRDWLIYQRSMVEWLIFGAVQLLIPLNCLLLASFVGRALPSMPRLMFARAAPWMSLPWYGLLRYPVRLALILVLLHASGMMDAILNFFSLESS